MKKSRLEAFSDGVIAIIITIMVLELKVPQGAGWAQLSEMWPVFSCYVLSFLMLAIYWNNHHHLLQLVEHVSGAILWANVHLLFWLSLCPFVTAWMGENHFAPLPVAMFGLVMLMSGVAYYILSQCLIHHHGRESKLAKAIGKDGKGMLSAGLYAAAIPLAFFMPSLSCAIYVAIAGIWLVPDSRIEKVIGS